MAEATETALACIREEVERAFSSAPGAVLEAALSRIAPADECARAAAYAAWDSIAHPLVLIIQDISILWNSLADSCLICIMPVKIISVVIDFAINSVCKINAFLILSFDT